MSTGAKRSALPGRWTLEVAPVDVDGKRSPSPGDPWKAGLGYDFKSNSVTGSVGNDHLKGSAYYDLYDSRYGGSLTYKNGAHSFGISGTRWFELRGVLQIQLETQRFSGHPPVIAVWLKCPLYVGFILNFVLRLNCTRYRVEIGK